MQFFLLFYFCNFLHAVTSALRNCLFVLLPGFLRFSIMCIFSSLPYFFFWFSLVLTWFFLLNCSLLHSFVVCRFLRCRLLVKCDFLSLRLNSFRHARAIAIIVSLSVFGLRWCCFFFHFFCSFRVCLFFFWGHWFAPSKVAGLRFFCAAVAILLF